jgi:hypothetical protein
LRALSLAAEVIGWARGGSTSRPEGRAGEQEALGLAALAKPSPELVEAAGALAARHAAKLGLRPPPLGDARPLGYGGLVLATAVGLAYAPALADAVASACPEEASAWDLVLRDAIVSCALGSPYEPDFLDTLRASSPLTAVLDRPAPGGEDEAIARIERLAEHPDGRRLVVFAFAKPAAPRAVRQFRAAALERLRLLGDRGRELVLDVYEAAFVHHRASIAAEIAEARVALGRGDEDRGEIEDALATAGFYGPLARVRRASPDALRRRPHLDLDGILEATRLHRASSRLLGEET